MHFPIPLAPPVTTATLFQNIANLLLFLYRISSLRQPLVVIVIRLARPPVKELVQSFDILIDTCAGVLLWITVDSDPVMTVGRKLYDIDAEPRPAAVSIKAVSLHIPEPLVLHLLWDVSHAECLHLLIGETVFARTSNGNSV